MTETKKEPQEMQKIASFCVDHTKLKKGMYISRIDDDIVTYDLRMVVPNTEPYLENAAIHTFEHLFATYVRNSALSSHIIYIGPMGCRTGFYFITRGIAHQQALDLCREALDFIANFTGAIPGVSAVECGNYREHNHLGACLMAMDYQKVLADWTVPQMDYDYQQ